MEPAHSTRSTSIAFLFHTSDTDYGLCLFLSVANKCGDVEILFGIDKITLETHVVPYSIDTLKSTLCLTPLLKDFLFMYKSSRASRRKKGGTMDR